MSRKFVVKHRGHEGGTIASQVRSTVKPGEIGVAIAELRPGSMWEVLHGLPAIAGEGTRDLQIEHRTIGFRKTCGDLPRKGLDVAGFTVPLRHKVLGVIAIEVVVAWLEGNGLVEQFARRGCSTLRDERLVA